MSTTDCLLCTLNIRLNLHNLHISVYKISQGCDLPPAECIQTGIVVNQTELLTVSLHKYNVLINTTQYTPSEVTPVMSLTHTIPLTKPYKCYYLMSPSDFALFSTLSCHLSVPLRCCKCVVFTTFLNISVQ